MLKEQTCRIVYGSSRSHSRDDRRAFVSTFVVMRIADVVRPPSMEIYDTDGHFCKSKWIQVELGEVETLHPVAYGQSYHFCFVDLPTRCPSGTFL